MIMRLKTVVALLGVVLFQGAYAQMQEMTDNELTVVNAQAGADLSYKFTFTDLDMNVKSVHATADAATADFVWMFQDMNGSISIDKIGLDGTDVLVRNNANTADEWVSAVKITFGGAPGNTTGATIKYDNFSIGKNFGKTDGSVTGLNMATESTIANAVPTATDNPLFGLHMNGDLNVKGTISMFAYSLR